MKKIVLLLLFSSCASAYQPAQVVADVDSVKVINYGYWKEEVALKPKATKTTETSWPLVTVFILAGIILWQ